MIVRRGTILDLEFIVEELKHFSDFYETKKPIFLNESNTSSVIKNFIDNHVCYVAEKDAEPCGFITGYFTPHPYNPKIDTLIESFWWVKEDKRNTRAALMLLNAFIEFGKQRADFIYLTLEDKSPIDEKHFTRRGFKLKEKNFFMEVQ